MTQLLAQAIQKAQALPPAEQDRVAQRLLEELERSGERPTKGEKEVDSYSSFKVLREARLPGPPDASVIYERELYDGRSNLWRAAAARCQ